jgi:thiamine biosynthesis lipoprotein
VLSVTVVAPTALLADALSTAFFVMGPQVSLNYCRARPEIGMVMICPGGHGGKTEIHRVGLDREELTMCEV